MRHSRQCHLLSDVIIVMWFDYGRDNLQFDIIVFRGQGMTKGQIITFIYT
jgi:hypothetical protein